MNIGENEGRIFLDDVVPDKSKRILTGDRPTGNMHIGHYFGSLLSRVDLQDKFDTYILIADVQALTDNFNNPEKVRKNVNEILIDQLSVRIDPNKATFFVQSMIPEIPELTIYYSNLVTMARLERNPTIKTEIAAKKELFGESVTYGFIGYPVSQAADITAFKGEIVPVGDDQLPLVEQAREIVRKFNSIYGEGVLKEPVAVISKNSRIRGLDGGVKMGKSLGNALYLVDTPEIVKEKVMLAKTDPARIKKDDPGHPEVCAVYYYHNLFTDKEECKNICSECRAGKRGCVSCKRQLIDSINKTLDPIREKRAYYEARPNEVKEILFSGTDRARMTSKETLREVKKAMMLDY
jgi:tryptophan--tRNA ligase